MPSSVDFSGRPFHFIGIGGIGMSAIAYILAKRKLPVYGSDIKSSHITERLQEMGAHIFWRQDASNFEVFQTAINGSSPDRGTPENIVSSVAGAVGTSVATAKALKLNSNGSDAPANGGLPQVVCSTAIHPANAEYRAALDLGCPIFHRSDVLAALIQDYQSIAVAGTHGKTTTSSLIGFMLMAAGLDPTIVVGGEVNAWEGNARAGQGPYLVAEADESDGSLVKLVAKIGIVTNVELDHPDHYESLDQVIDIFKVFAQNCQTLVGCIDDKIVKDCLAPNVSYSLNPNSGADYTVSGVEYGAESTKAGILERGAFLGEMELKLLGTHNLSNALAAVAVGRLLGLEFLAIAKAISGFEGARRRFEVRGFHNDILFVDDYAHHPSEILVTLAAARLRIEGSEKNQKARRVVAIFQPHRYSRTLTFLPEFAQSFGDADLVVACDIYSAGEPNLGKISGRQVADLIAKAGREVKFLPSLELVTQFLKENLQPGDLALFLGAGNLNQIIPEVMACYQAASRPD
ncbi:UDP-N-acetylmuramate--L-alanine ligase [Tychonema sp. LEGE 07199]|uniref:UDP-N-acetylmuramate--L-alanine ligase n=1 Tax=unclassified Tychonema TaxID=2642144 RepID=UPI001882E545|nr:MULTISPECIES: UDP-N-acetylmuramate--L-alanine ligase [unclassified Tychonema]MBE9121005.1 UDP-N-acetylmuramate--L-alanine ligase [Tychonema sp. LEGE 07199]MBE9133277.1 UDP-N-acetylmuramate--L-alanine ligase [Tychonema sp. LEGE 07196]